MERERVFKANYGFNGDRCRRRAARIEVIIEAVNNGLLPVIYTDKEGVRKMGYLTTVGFEKLQNQKVTRKYVEMYDVRQREFVKIPAHCMPEYPSKAEIDWDQRNWSQEEKEEMKKMKKKFERLAKEIKRKNERGKEK